MVDLVGKLLTKKFFYQPIFIVGGGRSGTIALLKAIGRHPEIYSSPSENPFITDVGGMVYALKYSSEREIQYYLRTLRLPYAYIYDLFRRLCLESTLGKHYGLKQIVKDILRKKVNILRKRYWCTKTFPTKEVALGLLDIYPQAKFIWIIRNGLNVIHSRTKFPEFRNLTFTEQCQAWANNVYCFKYLLHMPEGMVVRYEEFANDPERVFHKIFDHIRIKYHTGPALFAKSTLVHSLSDESTKYGVDVKKIIFDRPPVYHNWSLSEKTAFKNICGEAMTLLGYEIPF